MCFPLEAARWRDIDSVADEVRALGRRLIEQGEGGSIVNISSIAGKMYPPNTAAYASSKAAIHALTGSMAREIGAHGIRVNVICPGIIDTYRMDDLGRGEQWNKMLEQAVAPARARTSPGLPSTCAVIRAPGSRASPTRSTRGPIVQR